MKEIYLDNAAATSCDPKVLKEMKPYWSSVFGNSSSFNDAGRKAKTAMDAARKKIARILGAKDQEIIFTSSATESNNLAILGTGGIIKNNNFKIITTKADHHSVLEPIKKLEKDGAKVIYLSTNKEGLIKLEEFKKALNPDTILVSIIYASNEIGSIQPIKKISKIIKESKNKSGYPYFHIDAAQAVAYLDMNVNNLGVDLMTLSSSKIHGPKGIAALYVRQGTKIEPLIYGGGQEFGLRSATQAVPLIVGFAKALEITERSKVKNKKKIEELRKYLIEGLKKTLPSVKINGPENPLGRVPSIINSTFPGIENEQLLLYLDKYKIRASAGSACASYDIEPSHVLRAIGLSKKEARSSIRFSLGRKNTKAEIDYVLKILPKMVKKVKGLYPKDLKKYYYAR